MLMEVTVRTVPLCASLSSLHGPPKRDRSPQTMATPSLLADEPGSVECIMAYILLSRVLPL